MKTDEIQISPFFLSMFKHEMANGVNNLFQIGMSGIDDPDLDEGSREDLKFDHLEALDNSQIALNKLHTLLYSDLIAQSKTSNLFEIFESAQKALPLTPTTIMFADIESPNKQQYPVELATQILFGIFQLLIRNEQDGFDNDIKVLVSEADNKTMKIAYSGTQKADLFADLSNAVNRYDKKSKKAFEYEFLKHLVSHQIFRLTLGDSALDIHLGT